MVLIAKVEKNEFQIFLGISNYNRASIILFEVYINLTLITTIFVSINIKIPFCTTNKLYILHLNTYL